MSKNRLPFFRRESFPDNAERRPGATILPHRFVAIFGETVKRFARPQKGLGRPKRQLVAGIGFVARGRLGNGLDQLEHPFAHARIGDPIIGPNQFERLTFDQWIAFERRNFNIGQSGRFEAGKFGRQVVEKIRNI